jgi:aryl-alcohol dehydrogenase-like predicted oxidoreductase
LSEALGPFKVDDLSDNDFRKTLPRFSKENYGNNQSLAELFALAAKEKGCIPVQLAWAWVLAQGDESFYCVADSSKKLFV